MKQLLLSFIIFLLTFILKAQDLKLGVPIGHTNGLNGIEFIPKKDLVLTYSDDATARIWKKETGHLIHVLIHESPVVTVEVSNDQSMILTGSEDGVVKLWDVNNGLLIHVFNRHKGAVRDLKFSPNNNQVVSCDLDSSFVWDLNGAIHSVFSSLSSSKLISTETISYLINIDENNLNITDVFKDSTRAVKFNGINNISSGALSHDNSRLAIGFDNGEFLLFDMLSDSITSLNTNISESIKHIQFSDDQSMIITSSMDSTVRLWDASEGEEINVVNYPKRVIKSLFIDEEHILSLSEDGEILKGNLKNGKVSEMFSFVKTGISDFQLDQNGVIAISNMDGLSYLFGITDRLEMMKFSGKNRSNYTSLFLKNKEVILTTSDDGYSRIWSFRDGFLLRQVEQQPGRITSATSTPNSSLFVTGSFSFDSLRVWDGFSNRLKSTLWGDSTGIDYMSLSSNAKSLLIKPSQKDGLRLIDLEHPNRNYRKIEFEDKSIIHAEFHPVKNEILMVAKEDIRIEERKNYAYYLSLSNDRKKEIDWETNPGYNVLHGSFNAQGTKIALLCDFGVKSNNVKKLVILDSVNNNNNEEDTLFNIDEIDVNKLIFNPVHPQITVFADETASLGESNIVTYNFEAGSKQVFEGHTSGITDVSFHNNGTVMVSTSYDGSMILWDVNSGMQLIRQFIFEGDPDKWVHIHPSGLFDASPEAMDMMYWTKGLEVIEFSQLKDRYWLPGIWERVMSGKELPSVKNMNELKLYPKLAINIIDKNTLSVDLMKREGGYGAVKVLLNGKEISQDARGANFDSSKKNQNIQIDIKDHPFLKEGENKVTVIAASESGINSRGLEQTIYIDSFKSELPNFYAVVIGVGDYATNGLDLKYATKDAEGIAKAIQLGADGLFPNRNSIYSLTSNTKLKPSKSNIEKVFNEISKTAKSQDVILLYMAGHGVSTSSENGEFYFLTKDARSTSKEVYMYDEKIRENHTISTEEWVGLLKKIPALKQVMIIDACGSGKAVDNLLSMRDIDPSQIRAIDRMMDRTGMYVISGCAADAVSYEASQYGQGLLTFSILQGMKGAALEEEKFIDVESLLNHAVEMVPVLAEGVGGVQKPQLLKPKSGSFDIGILNEDSKRAIPLANPKRVFVRSNFLNSETFEDNLDLSQVLDERLILRSARGSNSDLVYFDVRNFPNACKLSGGYTKSGEQIALTLNIRCGDDLVTHTLTAAAVDEICNEVIALVRKSISSNK